MKGIIHKKAGCLANWNDMCPKEQTTKVSRTLVLSRLAELPDDWKLEIVCRNRYRSTIFGKSRHKKMAQEGWSSSARLGRVLARS